MPTAHLVDPDTGQIDGDADLAVNNDSIIDASASQEAVPLRLATAVKLERANQIHADLLNRAAVQFAQAKIMPKCSSLVDLYGDSAAGTIVVEVKSLSKTNHRSQFRKAFAQLHEYAFLHQFEKPILAVVTNQKPADDWLLEFLVRGQGISVAWLDGQNFVVADGSHTAFKAAISGQSAIPA
ncbi:MAG: hypothetical protein O3C10_07895 [Chloroflexi bacterium]|nr:hypothetical protein [Chloroflexota bacterium]